MELNGRAQVIGCVPLPQTSSLYLLNLVSLVLRSSFRTLNIIFSAGGFRILNPYLWLISRASSRETQLFIYYLSVDAWWLERDSWDLAANLCYFQLPTTCEWWFCASHYANIFNSLLTPLFLSYLSPANSVGLTVKTHHFSPPLLLSHGPTHHHVYMFLQWPLNWSLCLWHPQYSYQGGPIKLNVGLYHFFAKTINGFLLLSWQN